MRHKPKSKKYQRKQSCHAIQLGKHQSLVDIVHDVLKFNHESDDVLKNVEYCMGECDVLLINPKFEIYYEIKCNHTNIGYGKAMSQLHRWSNYMFRTNPLPANETHIDYYGIYYKKDYYGVYVTSTFECQMTKNNSVISQSNPENLLNSSYLNILKQYNTGDINVKR